MSGDELTAFAGLEPALFAAWAGGSPTKEARGVFLCPYGFTEARADRFPHKLVNKALMNDAPKMCRVLREMLPPDPDFCKTEGFVKHSTC